MWIRQLCFSAGVSSLHRPQAIFHDSFVLYIPDGAAGSLWGSLQSNITLWANGVLQYSPQTALPFHLPLLPPPNVQTEGHEVALLRGHETHGHLPLHSVLPLWRVQFLEANLSQRNEWEGHKLGSTIYTVKDD